MKARFDYKQALEPGRYYSRTEEQERMAKRPWVGAEESYVQESPRVAYARSSLAVARLVGYRLSAKLVPLSTYRLIAATEANYAHAGIDAYGHSSPNIDPLKKEG